jgi:dUTP pyrophosphatase
MSHSAKGELKLSERDRTESDNDNWINDIKEQLYNDEVSKPTIAKLTFDNTYRPVKWGENDEDLPYKWFDDANHELSSKEAYWDSSDIQIDDHGYDKDENVIDGQIATGEEMEEGLNNDVTEYPITATMKLAKWVPGLQKINEQRMNQQINDEHEIIYDDVGMSRPSRKTMQGQMRRLQKKHDTITTLNTRGLYRQCLKMQNDGGANRSITDQRTLLLQYEEITPYPINGVCDGRPALYCTGQGYLPWKSNSGEILLIRCYYSKDVADTIISPNDVVNQHRRRFNEWQFSANHDTNIGRFRLLARDGVSHCEFTAYNENNLWFHYNCGVTAEEQRQLVSQQKAIIRTLSEGASYELWHHRLGHPGEKVMSIIHQHVKGVPKLRKNHFYSCAACLAKNIKKVHIGEKKQYVKDPNATKPGSNCKPGEHLHMDFGFVRGSDWKKKDQDGKTVTSIDGNRSYLLIIDRATRYIWIFLTKTKHPPVSQVMGFLKRFKGLHRDATVTTDLGGELAKSIAFRKAIKEADYTLHTTGAHSSAQNGMAEKPNQDLARIMRALLYSSDLGSQYWSYALRHSVYLKNRLPHSSLKFDTPYERLNGDKPDLSKLKVFGSRVSIHNGSRKAKLDDIGSVGTFLTYKNTDKIMYVRDRKSGEERTATHAVFDEAYMAERVRSLPPMAVALQQAGYRQIPAKDLTVEPIQLPENELKIKLLHDNAVLPKRGSATAAGLDLYSSESVLLPPKTQHLLGTGVSMEIPPNHFGKLEIRSGLALKHELDLAAGVIDNDYRGEVKIILRNHGNKDFSVQQGDRIAQMLILPQPAFEIQEVENLTTDTVRGKQGFGSTGVKDIVTNSANLTSPTVTNSALPVPTTPAPIEEPSATPTEIPATPNQNINADCNSAPPRPVSPEPGQESTALPSPQSEIAPTYHIIPPTVIRNVEADLDYYPFCNVDISTDPYNDRIEIKMETKGTHATRGLNLKMSDTHLDTVEIIDCLKSTPAMKIKRWRTRLKNNRLLQIDGIPITCIGDVTKYFEMLDPSKKEVTLTIGLLEKLAMHEDDGLPLMYFDQLSTISKHLNNIKNDTNDSIHVHDINKNKDIQGPVLINMMKAYLKEGTVQAAKAAIPKPILPKSKQRGHKLTRRKLRKLDNWKEWQKSEWLQLQQYEDQDTFGPPCKLPLNANCLDLLWCYNIKDNGTLKARCVCNGKPSNKNTAVFGYTFAKSLDQVGSRTFWAVAAAKNMIVRGADASNAFAEADAPKIPLYVRIDQQYRDWYKNKYPDRPELPDDYVLPVKKALQGHPESPRLWAILINKILTTKLHFKPTTHEPCLYRGVFNDREVLFLRQVDDFAVACTDEATAIAVIDAIDAEMKIKIKDLGRLTRYNGVDITQSADYIKIHNETYINKVLEGHTWMQTEEAYTANKPIPMHSDKKYINMIEEAPRPESEKEKLDIQHRMGFNYRQAIGELIYAMVTCRPDISYPLIKLSQYSSNPAEAHYMAVKDIFYYLKATPSDGIYYWRPSRNTELPVLPLPAVTPSTYTPDPSTRADTPLDLIGSVDADWAGDQTHRKSITGIVLRLAGGSILYKSKFQDTVAMSSTEAEFSAACDAAKSILYVRSILEELEVSQHHATTLFIDNNGALMMGNAQQPTRRTRHMDIKKFVLIDWIEQDLLTMKYISTHDNYSDSMTKALGRQLHYRHFDYIMGRIRPNYEPSNQSSEIQPH